MSVSAFKVHMGLGTSDPLEVELWVVVNPPQ